MKRKLALIVAAVAVTGMVASSAFAQSSNSDNNSRAGWGKGDQNHVHVGPSGQSTHPGHHNWIWWWIWNFLRHFFSTPWWEWK